LFAALFFNVAIEIMKYIFAGLAICCALGTGAHAQNEVSDKAHEAAQSVKQAAHAVATDVKEGAHVVADNVKKGAHAVATTAKKVKNKVIVQCGNGDHALNRPTACKGAGGASKTQ
jgi:spore coat protein U-like protein